MVGDLKFNGDSRRIELAALERREGERSEPSRSGGAAKPRRAAAPPVPPDPEVVAKAQRRKFTAEYKLGIVEEADHAADCLDSDSLCMALTAPTVADRQFRTFDRIVLPVKCAWIATGNNIQLGGDMPRRCCWIRLDAKQSQPFRRTSFRHADLRAWVREHRGAFSRVLARLNAKIAAGRV